MDAFKTKEMEKPTCMVSTMKVDCEEIMFKVYVCVYVLVKFPRRVVQVHSY
jgi:hypothetical protein